MRIVAHLGVVLALYGCSRSGNVGLGPCVDLASCLYEVSLGDSGRQLPYYATSSLAQPTATITHAVIFNQGLDRDASNDFTVMVKAALLANQLQSTLIVTPHFEALVDTDGEPCSGHADEPAPSDALWTCDAWSDGLSASNDAQVTSYGALDTLISTVVDAFPQIKDLTVAGFSAGGQLTQRYAAANGVDHSGESPHYRYVVGSPSSYLYFDLSRPTNATTCTTTGCPDGFVAFDGTTACPTFNDWKYGTEALAGAAASFTPSQLQQAFLSRDLTYLLGSLDDGPTELADINELDQTCPAEAQGSYRLFRGLAFHAYASMLGAQQDIAVVSGCGHDGSCVFQSSAGLAATFPQ
jgi:pimeloyl-ACP methyl ester carboxylesterase